MKKETIRKRAKLGSTFCLIMTALVLLMLSGIGNGVKAQETYGLSLSDVEAAAGTTTTLNVDMTPGSGFNTMQLVVTFDTRKLEYQVPAGVAQAKGDDLKAFEIANGAGTLVINSNQAASGLVNMGYINMNPVTAGGNMLKLTFKVKEGVTGEIPVTVQVKELIQDNDGTPISIPTTVKAGTITIPAATPTTPDPTPEPLPTPDPNPVPITDPILDTDTEKVVEAINNAAAGDLIHIQVSNNEPIPVAILAAAKGKDINLAFDYGTYVWKMNGTDIETLPEDLKTCDLSVSYGTDAAISQLTGDEQAFYLKITDSGTFPFTASLYYPVDASLNGKTLYRYEYPESGGSLLFRDQTIPTEGHVLMTFTQGTRIVMTTRPAGQIDAVDCLYQTHVENIGWQGYQKNGAMSGTEGQALRLEGIEIKTGDSDNLGIEYQTHIQNIGWQDYKQNGDMSGTEGQALRLEAIRIRLTGTAADNYDVYYRVHAQNVGWMGWAKNGESAGTAGFGYRLEGIEIMILPTGSEAPASLAEPFIENSAI